jgi:hypothetical protein
LSHRHRSFFGSSRGPHGLSRALGPSIGVLGLLVGLLVTAPPQPAAAVVTTGPLTWSAPTLVDQAPSGAGDAIQNVSCPSSSLCVGIDENGRVVTSTNPGGGAGTWSTPVTIGSGNSLSHISCPTTSLCVGVTAGAVVTSTDPTGGAAAWSAPVTVDGGSTLYAISCVSTSLCVAVDGSGNVVTSTNPTGGAGAWSAPVNVDGTNYFNVVSCPSASLCVAFDDSGKVVTSTNPTGGAAAWNAPVTVDSTGTIDDVSCPSTSLCVAFDNHGNVLTSTNPAGGAGAWSALVNVESTTAQLAFAQISCPSSSLCVVVDGAGNVLTSTDPTGGAGAWSAPVNVDGTSNYLQYLSCPSTSLCVAFDIVGNEVLSTNPTGGAGAWSSSALTVGTDPLSGSCGSPSLCVAFDTGGRVVTSTNPSGGASAWSAPVTVDSTGGVVDDVSCVSTSLCAAVDSSGNVVASTNPTGGASAWSAPVDVDGASTLQGKDISCPSTSLCVAVDGATGDVVTSTNPTGGAGAWSAPVTIDPKILGMSVSCPSTSLCVAVDSQGDVVTSTNPTGGASAWSAPVNVDTNGYLADISCPSASLCVAVDDSGDVVTSTNPTGGASAWSAPANIDPVNPLTGTLFFYSVSCPSSSLCVAVDSQGDVVTSTNPTGGSGAWSAPAQIDAPATLKGGASCPSTSLCVAFDTGGNVLTATGAAPVVPVVTNTTPANGATGVAAKASVSAVFSEAMNESTTAGAFSLQDDTTGQAVAGSVVWSAPTTPSFVPTGGSLTPGDQYTATISTAATAQSGPALASPVSWSFTLAPPVVPVVTSTSPANGATGVATDASVSAVFSEAMDETSTAGAFSLQDDTTGQAVPGIVEWSAPTTPSFVPLLGSLNAGEQYTATISTAALAASGPALASPVSWSFTVAPNTAQVVTPSNGATLSGTTLLDGAATNPSAVTTFQYELTGGSYTNKAVATAKPTIYGWLAQESNGTWGWDSPSVPNGTYTLSAVVTYNDGRVVTSPGVSITVSNPPPTAQVLIPSAGATVTGTSFLDGTASYTPDITQFTYELDGTAIGNAVASPWGWLLLNWNTTAVANGSHTLTAVATYANGASATSPGVTVTIANP